MKRTLTFAGITLVLVAAVQAVLYGPSLIGKRVLLPLDILEQPGHYIPPAPGTNPTAHNPVLSDPVLAYEPMRRFAVESYREGRIPLWNPYTFAGTPYTRWEQFSPYLLPYFVLPPARAAAWVQLLKALVAGLGAFLFFRRVGAGPGAAIFGGVAYTVCGYQILWQGYPISAEAGWLPWMLLAVEAAATNPRGAGGVGVALVTALVLVTGHPDVAIQVLIATALYAVGRFALRSRIPRRGWAMLIAGGVAGMLLAAPYLLPLAQHARSGERTGHRQGLVLGRNPAGLVSLPQLAFPEAYGSWERNDVRLVPGNRLESAAAGYAGLATLVLAAFAFAAGGDRRRAWIWAGLGAAGVLWSLNLPGVKALGALPGLGFLSHNRFVFLTGFSVLALAVMGLDRIAQVRSRRPWFLVAAVLVLLGGWNLVRAESPPPSLSEQAGFVAARQGEPPAAVLTRVQATFRRHQLEAAVWCLALAGLAAAAGAVRRRTWAAPALAGLAVLELVHFGTGRNPQVSPKLYYPEIPILSRLAASPPGRILGVRCFPPDLNLRFHLSDVRGYDGIDQARIVDIMNLARDPSVPPQSNGATVWYVPRLRPASASRAWPLLDLLDVRYLLFQGEPPAGVRPFLSGDGYWVLQNRGALPRAFVPRSVAVVADREARLRRMADPSFDPAATAFVERPVDLPAAISGEARIRDEDPERVRIEAAMQTPGLLVLADSWMPGWRVTVDGRPAEVLRADHALLGVAVPAGNPVVEFRYRPGAFRTGVVLMVGGWVLVAGLGLLAFRDRRSRRVREGARSPGAPPGGPA